MVAVQASDNVSEEKKKTKQVGDHNQRESKCVFVWLTLCVCVYLQVVVVSPAAAVELLGGALVQVKNRAEITEIP